MSASVLELSNGDLVVYDETGQGVWLTRARVRRPFNPVAYARRVDAETRLLEERVWIPALQKFFFQQGDALAKRMRSRSRRLNRATRDLEVRREPLDIDKVRREATRRATAMVDEIFDAEEFRLAFLKIVEALYDEVALTALESTGVALAVDFEVAARRAVLRAVTQRANQLAGHVSTSTYRALTRHLRDGILRGESIPDLAARVQNGLQGASRRRATVIARTEVMSAYNSGVYHGGTTLPPDVAAGMVWIATNDGRTRPSHKRADGQMIEMGETFIVDGEELRYPGDSRGSAKNTINCRCATAILTPEDMESRMLSMHTVSDILVRMAVYDLSYRQALVALRASDEEVVG